MNINLSTITFSISDPDHPTIEKLSKTSTKQERTGIAMLKIVQSPDCFRQMYADYLGDKSPNGELAVLIMDNFYRFDSSTIHDDMVLRSTFGTYAV